MRFDNTIDTVVGSGLCTGCGTCAAMCPRHAIELLLDKSKTYYVPHLNKSLCNLCGTCLAVCPGHGVNFKQLNLEVFGIEPRDSDVGNYLKCAVGYSTDLNIRYNASSGGMITTLLLSALNTGQIQGALVTKLRIDSPLYPHSFIARTRDEIISATGSKYCPVPANIALKDILEAKAGERFAVVGVPCQIQGIRKAESFNPSLKERIALHFSLFCSHQDKFSEIAFVLQRHGITMDQVSGLAHRGHGYPGGITVRLKNSTEIFLPLSEHVRVHELFMFAVNRCLLCCDALGKLSDITFQDAWLPDVIASDKVGTSIVWCRSERGSVLLETAQARREIQAKPIGENDALKQHGKTRIHNGDLKANLFISSLLGKSIPRYDILLPRPSIRIILRVLVIHLNIWISSKNFLLWLIDPMIWIQGYVFKLVKKII